MIRIEDYMFSKEDILYITKSDLSTSYFIEINLKDKSEASIRIGFGNNVQKRNECFEEVSKKLC